LKYDYSGTKKHSKNLPRLKLVLQPLLLVSICVIILVIPSINLQSYVNSSITSKYVILWHLVIISVALCIFKSLLEGLKYQISSIDIVLLVVGFYLTFNRFFFQEKFGFSIKHNELLLLSVFYLLLKFLRKQHFILLLIILQISCVSQVIHGYLQLFSIGTFGASSLGVTGSFSNPGPFAGFFASVWPVSLGMILYREKLQDVFNKLRSKKISSIIQFFIKWAPLICLIGILLIIPSLKSRASLMSIFVSSILLWFTKPILLQKIGLYKNYKKLILSLFICSTIFFLIFGLYFFNRDSANGRLLIWKVSKDIFLDYPLLGIGYDNFSAYYMNYQADFFLKNKLEEQIMVADNTNYAFNDVLQFILENGIVGFLLLILLVVYILKPARYLDKASILWKISVASISGIIFFSFFSYPSQILPIKIVFVICLAIVSRELQPVFIHSLNRLFVLPTLTLILIALLSNDLTKQRNGFKQMKLAEMVYKVQDYEGSIELYDEYSVIFSKYGFFLSSYGKALSMNNQHQAAIETLEEAKKYLNNSVIETGLGDSHSKLGQFEKAEISYTKSHLMTPNRFYPLFQLLKLYEQTNSSKKVDSIGNVILSKRVKINSTAIREIKVKTKFILTKNQSI